MHLTLLTETLVRETYNILLSLTGVDVRSESEHGSRVNLLIIANNSSCANAYCTFTFPKASFYCLKQFVNLSRTIAFYLKSFCPFYID